MPRCDCGFDFVRARLTGRKLESYALISDDNYRAVIRKETAILKEKEPQKKLALIGKAAASVGSLVRCPKCSAWLLSKPRRSGQSRCIVLRKTQLTANKSVQRTGASRFGQKAKRKSLATGSGR